MLSSLTEIHQYLLHNISNLIIYCTVKAIVENYNIDDATMILLISSQLLRKLKATLATTKVIQTCTYLFRIFYI